MRNILVTFLTVLSFAVVAQDDLPTDYLTKEFHAGRRAALREKMPAKSVAVVVAFPTRTYSNDVEYLYHPNPDLYYFTGYREPHSMLMVFKEPQTAADGTTFDELLVVQKKNAQAEQWTGRRLGVEGVQQKLGIKNSINGEDFKGLAIDFASFDKIIFDRIPNDLPAGSGRGAELATLVTQFKEKAAIPTDYSKEPRYDTRLYRELTTALREIKTPEEMELLRKAIEISCLGQNEVMKTVNPNMSELEIQGLHEYVHKKYGSEEVGYGSIVGAGENGCILHYMENTKTKIGTSMLLMDVGAAYHGYTSDVTRTIPVDGKFSAEERAIYQLVYDAQEAVFAKAKDNTPFSEIEAAAREVVTQGLIKLGIAKTTAEANQYYPHGCSHHIGMDVHDRGSYKNLKKNMVITVEPGIYIPEGSKCDKKWWGIAVRIEDDILIREKDNELLSSFSPRSIEAIEKMIAEKSVLDNYTLPKLKSGKKGF
ncbi:MAG: aminopeptidase P N-terminal domain-containing protein [Chitinophagaceae bacterium]|nr:aminopeptidase P N-terminal domain-containing protein [Chitinophagaceae bacterium]